MVNFKHFTASFFPAVFIFSMPLYASEPFGIPMGASISSLPIDGNGTVVEEGLYKLQSVPSPSPYFSDYYAIGSPKAGVCMVGASSPVISDDYRETIPYLQYLSQEITNSYGKIFLITNFENIDELDSGNYSNVGKANFSSDDLIASFYLDESVLLIGNSSNGNVTDFYLTSYQDSEQGYKIEVIYSYNNIQQCQTEMSDLYE